MDYNSAISKLRELHPWATEEQLRGDVPYRVAYFGEHELASYFSPSGCGNTADGKLQFGDFRVSDRHTIFIQLDTLIIDYNSSAPNRSWQWRNTNGGEFHSQRSDIGDYVGPRRLAKIIDRAPEQSRLWNMFHARALELFDAAEYKGDYRE